MVARRRFFMVNNNSNDHQPLLLQHQRRHQSQQQQQQQQMKRVVIYAIISLSIICVFLVTYPTRQNGDIYEVWNSAQLWYLQHNFPLVVVEGDCNYEDGTYRPFRTDFLLFEKHYPTIAFAYFNRESFKGGKMIVVYAGSRIVKQYDCNNKSGESSATINQTITTPTEKSRGGRRRAMNLTGVELEKIKSNENVTSLLVLYRTHWDRHSERIDSALDGLASRLESHHAIVARHYCDEGIEPGAHQDEKHEYPQNRYCRENGIGGYPTTLIYVKSQIEDFQDGLFGHDRNEENLFAFWFSNVILRNDIERALQNHQSNLRRQD